MVSIRPDEISAILKQQISDYDKSVSVSNVGTVLISQKLGQQKTYDWIQRFGFGQKTGFDYPGEVTGSLPKFEDWSGVSILNIPIGQGISTTMVQIAEAYGAIANRGRMVPPHIIQKIGNKVLPHPRVASAEALTHVYDTPV